MSLPKRTLPPHIARLNTRCVLSSFFVIINQSINVYCPNLAFIQLTTRRRRLLVTLDQLHTILQSTGFTTGCLPNQVLFTMISLVLLGCVRRCPFWPHSSPSLSALRFPIRLLSFPQGGSSSVRRHASQAISLSWAGSLSAFHPFFS